MKKRLLITLFTICTVISITIGIASFSYAWLSTIPTYEFTLSTGDYPLLVNTNIYVAKFNNRAKTEIYNTYDPANSNSEITVSDGTLGYQYGDTNGNILKLDKTKVDNYNYKSYVLNNETGQMIPNVNGNENSACIEKLANGIVNFNFPLLNCNIFDSEFQSLSMIGNSDNNYALNAKYFYCGFVEFLFLKQFFNAYLICIPEYDVTSDSISKENLTNLVQFTFIDSDQNDSHFNYNNSKSSYINVNNDGSVSTNGINNQTEDDIFYNYTSSENREFRNPSSTIQRIYQTEDKGVTYSGREIAAISRVDSVTASNCYSYASIYGIYLNPIQLFDIIKQKREADIQIKLSLTFKFYLSDNNMTNEDIENLNAGA